MADLLDMCKAAGVEVNAGDSASKQVTDDSIDIDPLIDMRLSIERTNLFKPFTLMAYKPNFIIPLSYNRSGYDASLHQQQLGNSDIEFDDYESQFQISIKTPLADNVFNRDVILYAGYTNRSFWQVYNSGLSRPFRETNHEPELWLQSVNRTRFFGFDNRISMLGLSHQSNGQGGVLSRSWNRLYANVAFEKMSFVFAVKAWYRFDESSATDDNPDITDYMGHGEFRALYKRNENTFSIMSRNNLESGFKRGATELSWSFSIGKRKDMRGYIQLFSGYGESLIDYNQSVNRIGFGISLSDWL